MIDYMRNIMIHTTASEGFEKKAERKWRSEWLNEGN